MNVKALLAVVIILIGFVLIYPFTTPVTSEGVAPLLRNGKSQPVLPLVQASPEKTVAQRAPVSALPYSTPIRTPRVRVASGVIAAKFSQRMTVQLNSAFSLSQLEAAKAKAVAECKPLGFIMVWGQFFGKQTDTRSRGSEPAMAHFYRAFNANLVLVFVRHETELGSVPDAVKQGFNGPDEGGYAPNMAVVDATASEFIVEIPYGGTDSNGEKRDQVFSAGAAKIDQWLATHPLAVAVTPGRK